MLAVVEAGYRAGATISDIDYGDTLAYRAQDFLWFCRLSDKDGTGSTAWLNHVKTIARRSAKLTKQAYTAIELRGPGTELEVRLAPSTRWLGGQEQNRHGAKLAPNMPTE